MKLALACTILAFIDTSTVLGTPWHNLHRLVPHASPAAPPPTGCVINYATPFELQPLAIVSAGAKIKRAGWDIWPSNGVNSRPVSTATLSPSYNSPPTSKYSTTGPANVLSTATTWSTAQTKPTGTTTQTATTYSKTSTSTSTTSSAPKTTTTTPTTASTTATTTTTTSSTTQTTSTTTAAVTNTTSTTTTTATNDCPTATGAAVLTLSNSVLTDSAGNTYYIAANHQLQSGNPPPAGAIYRSGFSVCSNGSLALGGSTVFYQCTSGGFTSYYDEQVASTCPPVFLDIVNEPACL